MEVGAEYSGPANLPRLVAFLVISRSITAQNSHKFLVVWLLGDFFFFNFCIRPQAYQIFLA